MESENAENIPDKLRKKMLIEENKIKTEYIELIDLLQKFIEDKVENNKILTEQFIFLIANSDAQVFRVISSMETPDFLQIDNTEYLDFRTEVIGVNSLGLTADNKEIAYVHEKEHSVGLLQEFTSISIPIKDKDDKLCCIIGVLVKNKNPNKVITDLVKLLLDAYHSEKKLSMLVHKKDSLGLLTKKLYATFDANEVLSEAVKYLNLFYPDDKLELWLTHDYKLESIPTNLLTNVINSENVINQSFIEGKIFINQKKGELVTPIRGNQGIYGVLKIKSPTNYDSLKSSFITDIAEIIGLAFENANLYEQSISSVKKFQLINDLSKVLNRSLNEEEILQGVIHELNKVYKSQYISFFKQINEGNEFQVVASNSEKINNIVPINDSYIGLAYKKKEPIIIADNNQGYETKDTLNDYLGYHSLIAVPIFIENEIISILSIGSKQSNYFTYDDLKTLELFAQHLGLALTNSYLYGKIKCLAITDYLTNLYNRSFLDGKIKASQNSDKRGALLLFDIDNFKSVNDIYGHQIGDQVLVQVANIFKSSIRGEDVAARWGGEELAIYLPRADVGISKKIGERIVNRVREETNPKITISCGVATWSFDEKNTEYLDIVHRADEALYMAKNNGKDQLRISKE